MLRRIYLLPVNVAARAHKALFTLRINNDKSKLLLFFLFNYCIILENGVFDTSMYWQENKIKDGQTEFKILQNITLNMDPDRIRMNFENLFNSQRNLGDNINTVLNENWKEVWADVRYGYEKSISLLFVEITNDFFISISLEDAFD